MLDQTGTRTPSIRIHSLEGQHHGKRAAQPAPADRQPARAGADEATCFFIHQGNASITFSAARVDHKSDPGPVSRVVVGGVVLPVAAAAGLAVGLYDFLRNMGIDPARPAPDQAAH